jgi:hypothetical protein
MKVGYVVEGFERLLMFGQSSLVSLSERADEISPNPKRWTMSPGTVSPVHTPLPSNPALISSQRWASTSPAATGKKN